MKYQNKKWQCFFSSWAEQSFFRITQTFKTSSRVYLIESFVWNSVSLDASLVWPHFNNIFMLFHNQNVYKYILNLVKGSLHNQCFFSCEKKCHLFKTQYSRIWKLFHISAIILDFEKSRLIFIRNQLISNIWPWGL